MKKIATLLAVLSLATACIYPFQPDFENENVLDDILVVDGNILIGEESTVRISFMTNMWPKKVDPAGILGSDTRASSPEKATTYYIVPEYAKNVTVWAEDDGGDKYEATLDEKSLYSSYASNSYVPGLPYTISTEDAPADRTYRLCVRVKDLLYTSDWVKPMAPPVLKKVTFKSSKTDVTVCATLDGGADATGYVLITFDETWRFHAERYPYFEYNPDANMVTERLFTWERYWCWMSSDQGTQVPVDYTGMSTSSLKEYPIHHFSRYDNRNHQRYSVLVKARTIDKDTYLYLSHLEENSQAGGNLFSPNPGEVAGNLRCETDPERMVLGFVTVGRSTSMRAYLDGRYLLSRALSPYELAYPQQWGQGEENPGWPEYYRMGYMPTEENSLPDPDPNFGPYGWASGPCYDCIAAGGTQEKPDFWDD